MSITYMAILNTSYIIKKYYIDILDILCFPILTLLCFYTIYASLFYAFCFPGVTVSYTLMLIGKQEKAYKHGKA